MTADQASTPDDWYYTDSGARIGPVSRADIQIRVQSGSIAADASVWRAGMPDWVPVRQSELSECLPAGPPPLTKEAINNGYSWSLALAPIWGSLVQAVLTPVWEGVAGEFGVGHFGIGSNGAYNIPIIDHAAYYYDLWWIVVLANLTMSYLDNRALVAAGHNVSKLAGWMLFVVPVYIYQRDKLLGFNMARFWVWMGAFVVSLSMDQLVI